MSQVVSMTIPGDPEFIKVITMAVRSLATLADFNIDAIDDIEISVAEAAKIITCHNFDYWCTSYDISVETKNNKITIDLSSKGDCHKLEKTFHPCTDCPSEGDIGGSVISCLMDETEVETDELGNKHIVLVKYNEK